MIQHGEFHCPCHRCVVHGELLGWSPPSNGIQVSSCPPLQSGAPTSSFPAAETAEMRIAQDLPTGVNQRYVPVNKRVKTTLTFGEISNHI